jgi:o-succinylbenzoate synthase
MESDDGYSGWGDVAPLPGFSKETVEDAVEQLTQIRRNLIESELPPEPEALNGALGEWLPPHAAASSVLCGIEMAVLNLMAESRRTSLAGLLSERAPESVRLNGLITGEDDVTEIVRRLKREGYRAVKLKVGRRPLAEDIRRTQDAFHELGGDTALRLDANRSWTMEDALSFAREIADCTPAYIEEPLADPSDLEAFAATAGLPVALDETLVGTTPSRLADYSYAAAVVLKPTLLGGFGRTVRLAREARSRGMQVVISSSFESSVGIAALAQLAAAFDTFNTPAGLDTLGFFESDLLIEPIDIAHGRIRIGQATRVARNVNLDLLEEVGP